MPTRSFAADVARRLARIHAATAADPAVAGEFPTDAIFHAIRLEPYLLATARAHPDLAAPLERLAAVTAATKRALVHGDVSPKNILVGPRGPVFLDAECAWWGDPAFDLAFCLNHLLLKCLWTPPARAGFLACFDALAAAYLAGVDWEPPAALEARAARLLPGLFLARVDGKSPVEYLTTRRTRTACGGRRGRCSRDAGRAARRRAAKPGGRSWSDELDRDRLRARPPRLGQPRAADGGGRGGAGRRRGRAGHRAGRRLHRLRRGGGPARRRRRPSAAST